MTAFFLLVSSVAASMLVIPLAWRLAPHIGMVDLPDPRKVHTLPVPRVGGWGIVAGLLLPLLLLRPLEPLLQSFVAGTLLLFAFGAWDDARQISHWPKFAGQLIAVGLVVFWGDLYVTRLPFFDGEVLDEWSGRLLTIVAMVGVINAVNHSDGLDGLAAGETLLSLVAVAFLGYLAGAPMVTNLALLVIGGVIGFLRYNTHPARVFMGDAGSQVLGFAIGFLVVCLLQKANQAASAALPLLLLGLPIADILVVLYKRVSGGMNWFKATRNHAHHRLLDLGFSHYQSVVAIYSLQALLAGSAVVLRYAADSLVIAVYFGAIIALFAALEWAERTGWQLSSRTRARLSRAGPWLQRLRHHQASQQALLWAIVVTVPLLFLFTTLWVQEVPRDFGAVAALLAAVVVLVSVSRPSARPMVLRVAIYIAAAFAAWLFVNHPRTAGLPVMGMTTAIVVALALVVAVFVRFTSSQRFETTPTDYLIVFALLSLLLFGRVAGGGAGADSFLRFIGYAIVLFYGSEVIIGHFERWKSVLGASSVAALLIVALRGLAAPF